MTSLAELEAVESALEPAQRGKVADAARRGRAVSSNLSKVQKSIGRDIRPPAPPLPEPVAGGRGKLSRHRCPMTSLCDIRERCNCSE